MSSSASLPSRPLCCSEEEAIEYAKLVNQGKTKKHPAYDEYPSARLSATTASPLARTPTIAEHSYVMAGLCFGLPVETIPDLNIAHCIELSIVYGMKLVTEDLCRGNPAEKLLEELKTRRSLASQIVLEVDKIAMLLLTSHDTEAADTVSIMESLPWLGKWAHQIFQRPATSQVSAVMTGPVSTEWSVHNRLRECLQMQHTEGCKSLSIFARTVARLPKIKRQGWVNQGIPEVESVAGHCWSMAAFCFLLTEDGKVVVRDAVRLCVVHDLAESLVGDITYRDKVPRQEKHQRERDTMALLQRLLHDDAPLMSSWDEFESAETPTGRIASDLDKVDLVIQALIYENKEGEKLDRNLDEFFVSAKKVKVLSGLIEEVIKARKNPGSRKLDPVKQQELDEYYGTIVH